MSGTRSRGNSRIVGSREPRAPGAVAVTAANRRTKSVSNHGGKRGVRCLDHHPDDRFGPGRTHQDPAAVPQFHGRYGYVIGHLGDHLDSGPAHRHTDQYLRHPMDELGGQVTEGPASPSGCVQGLDPGKSPVTGSCQITKDEVTRLLSAQHPTTGLHRLQDVPVADRHLVDRNPPGGQAPPEP